MKVILESFVYEEAVTLKGHQIWAGRVLSRMHKPKS